MILAKLRVAAVTTKNWLLCLAALSALLPSMNAQANEAAHCRFVNRASLALNVDGLSANVDGSVNHEKTLMLIDSGAQNTLLTKMLALKLRLPAPAATGKGKKGAVENRSQVNQFAVGAIELGAIPILTLQRAAEYPQYGALIGADFLLQHDMELSLADHKLKFFDPQDCAGAFLAYWDDKSSSVPLGAMSATDRRPVVEVEVDGRKMRALIDTASPISMMNLASAATVGITPQSGGVTPMRSKPTNGEQDGSPKAAHAAGWIAPFHQFSIGEEVIKNIRLPILDLSTVVNAEDKENTPDLILGEDFLQAHHILFAVSQHKFYFSYLGGNVFNLDTQAAAGSTPAK